MYQRIVVAVDGSPTAKRALAEAIRLAGASGASLLLLHVTEEPLPLMIEGDWTLPAIPLEQYQELGRRILEEAAAQAAAAGVQAQTKLVEAAGRRIGRVVSEEAQAWQADLIVAGTHGRRGLDRLLLGSVAEGIVRTARVSVLLVPSA